MTDTLKPSFRVEMDRDILKRIGRVGGWGFGPYLFECTTCGVCSDGARGSLVCLPCALAARAETGTGVAGDCWCYRCAKAKVDAEPWSNPDQPIDMRLSRYFLCPTCGNKRCPRSTHHIFACTASNDSGQDGSMYGVEYVAAPAPVASPVAITDDMVEAGAQAIVDVRWNGTQPSFDRKPAGWKAQHIAEARACILAALAPASPADQKGGA